MDIRITKSKNGFIVHDLEDKDAPPAVVQGTTAEDVDRELGKVVRELLEEYLAEGRDKVEPMEGKRGERRRDDDGDRDDDRDDDEDDYEDEDDDDRADEGARLPISSRAMAEGLDFLLDLGRKIPSRHRSRGRRRKKKAKEAKG